MFVYCSCGSVEFYFIGKCISFVKCNLFGDLIYWRFDLLVVCKLCNWVVDLVWKVCIVWIIIGFY